MDENESRNAVDKMADGTWMDVDALADSLLKLLCAENQVFFIINDCDTSFTVPKVIKKRDGKKIVKIAADMSERARAEMRAVRLLTKHGRLKKLYWGEYEIVGHD